MVVKIAKHGHRKILIFTFEYIPKSVNCYDVLHKMIHAQNQLFSFAEEYNSWTRFSVLSFAAISK